MRKNGAIRMNLRLRVAWESLRASFWFLPALLSFLGLALAGAAVLLDELVQPHYVKGLWWLYSGGPDGARSVLSTVATSMITVAGTTFSITIAVLTLASQQFGPRLLRTFTRDRGNQAVLGTFLGTFIFCLTVLRTVRGSDAAADQLVPLVSVTFGAVLGVASLGSLVYFIHHVSNSIRASHVIEDVGRVLDGVIDRLYPESLGDGGQPKPEPPQREAGTRVEAARSGYLISVDADALLRLAEREDLLVKLEVRPGKHVVRGDHVATLWPRRADGPLGERLLRAFTFSSQRTELQDVEFAVEQLVEVCVRALSPGINDPFTAINAIDRLAVSLSRLAGRPAPSPFRYGVSGRLRVIARRAAIADVVRLAFDQPRQNAAGHSAVSLRLLDAIATIARHTEEATVLAELHEQVNLVVEGSQQQVRTEADLSRLRERARLALEVITAVRRREIPGPIGTRAADHA